MNPKSVNDLDPKLKEAYDRIMGTSVGTNINANAPAPSEINPAASSPQNPTPEPAKQSPSPQPVMQTQTIDPNPVGQSTLSVLETAGANPIQPPPPNSNNNIPQAPAPPMNNINQNIPAATKASPQKKKSGLLPLLAFIGGTIFFVVYGIVWAKVFGLF